MFIVVMVRIMAKFICNVEHSKLGFLEVLETGNGARVYAKSEDFGALQFQSAKQQKELRALVIATGCGDDLSRKPDALELANFAPETPDFPPVSVADAVETEAPPETVPETPKKKGLFKVGLFGGGQ